MFKKISQKFSKSESSTNWMILFMSSSNMISSILTIVSGLLVARWILPDVLGQFNSYTIFSSYIILAQLGIPIALGRDLPFYLGRGETDKAEKYASVSQFYSLVLGSIVFAATTLLSLYFLFQEKYVSAAGSFVVGLLSFEGLYVTQYLKVLFRGNRDFNRLALIGIIDAFLSLGGIVFVYYWGFYGMCIRAFMHFALVLGLSWYWRPTKVKPSYRRHDFFYMLRLGFPMFLVTQVYALWSVLQKTMILTMGGRKYLGLYVLASVVQGSMETISGSLGTVTYATMARDWGKGKRIEDLFRLAIKPVVFSAIFFMVTIPIAWLMLPLISEKLIPNYVEGVFAAQWMLIAGFISLFNVWTNIYNVVNDQKQKLFSFLWGISAWLTTLLMLYKFKGLSLEIFPQSMAIGFFLIMIYNLIYIRKNRNLTYEPQQ